MAMLEGTITINPATGDAVKTGFAAIVFDALEASSPYGSLAASNPPAYAAAREQLAVMARAVAKVIPYIVANAQVTTPAGVTVATTGTAAAQTGATTAPGVGTVT